MAKPQLLGADYLLLLLYFSKKPIKGSVRLTKMMFLFEKEILPALKKDGLVCEKFPSFIAYNFGPFSKDLYEQVEFFNNIEFIKMTNINLEEEMGDVDDWYENAFDEFDDQEDNLCDIRHSKSKKYEIAQRGQLFTEKELLNKLEEKQIALITSFINKIINTSVKDILYYVYSTYPEYAENSLIKRDVLGDDE